jgi:general secretion pathway protein I
MNVQDRRIPLKSLTLKDGVGFTLIEVIIAMAVLGIALGLIIALFAGGLRSARLTDSYSQALLLARDKMDEGLVWNGLDAEEAEEDASGTMRDYYWERTVSPFLPSEEVEEENYPDMYKVEVKVRWREGLKEKEIALQGLVIDREAEMERRDVGL